MEEKYSILLDYAEGRINAEERLRAEELLKSDAKLREEFQIYLDNKSVLKNTYRCHLKNKLYTSYQEEQTRKRNLVLRKNIYKYVSLISSVAACVLLVLFLVQPNSSNADLKNGVDKMKQKSMAVKVKEYVQDTVYLQKTNTIVQLVKDSLYMSKRNREMGERFEHEFLEYFNGMDSLLYVYKKDLNNPDYRVIFGDKDSIFGLARLYDSNAEQNNNEFAVSYISNQPQRHNMVEEKVLIKKSDMTLEELYKLDKRIHNQIDSLQKLNQ